LSLLDKSRNPVNDARKIVHELSEHIEKIESVASEVLAQKKGIEDRVEKAEKGVEEFCRYAAKASKTGDKELARDCLKRQMEYEHQLVELKKELEHFSPRAEKIKDRLTELRKAHASATR
jgi:phage shock protein A